MKYLYIFLTATLISCGGGSSESTADEQSSPGENSCLARMPDPATWYSLSAVASLVNQPEESIEQKANEKFNQCLYSWKSDRTHVVKAGNIEMEVPSNNVIAITIKNLDEAIERAGRMHKNKTFTYAEYFDGYYSQPTEEEQKKIDEAIDKKAEEDKNMKTAKGLLALAKTENYTELGNIGDKANYYVQTAPGLRETRLAILQGNVVVLVNVDISDDDATDLTTATSVAETILSLCD